MEKKPTAQWVLGLDLGASSIGWALIEQDGGEYTRIIDTGSRVFEAGVEGDMEAGQEKSRAADRRAARLTRRQADRRARRRRRVATALQEAGLLPPGDVKAEQARHELLHALDRELHAAWTARLSPDARAGLDQLPYFLRARALDEPLEPFALGRALYHLSERRGFLSNRRSPKDDKEEGVVKKGISELNELMHAAGARTLGEYFAGLDPHEKRIRQRWTARRMYLDEFDAIWAAQAPHHPEILTDAFRKRLHDAIFFQRPLRSQKGLVGKCELEPGRRRAPMSLLEAQRFRLLQKVNDLRLIGPDFQDRPLTEEERAVTLDLLDRQQEVKFTALRKALKTGRGWSFNLEKGDETRLMGNVTAAKLRAVFGDRWDAFSETDKDRVLADLRSYNKDEALKRRGMRAWGLDEEKAAAFAQLRLEDDYCRISRTALRKLVPLMEQGVAYMTARDRVYGKDYGSIPTNTLPPLNSADCPIELRNPAVHRALTELRKVVNALVDRYGKPDYVRIELARDLKRSRKEREQMSRKNRQNEKGRDKARRRIIAEAGIQRPTRDAIQRVVLAEECGWTCPYTGRTIGMSALIGEHSQFDIEHIIPYSRCLDNSFANKTLCYHEENRHAKRNRTPFEAYGHDEQRWHEILERVRRFTGPKELVEAKLRRFRTETLEDFADFTSRHLTDTRYVSTLAADYLAMLYGGQIDANGVRRIQAGRGQITSDLRLAWGLNNVLGTNDTKSRDDHRHHAVDAIVIALTDARTVKALSTANEKAGAAGRRDWRRLVPPPWDAFQKDVIAAVGRIVVSHRTGIPVHGAFHEETYYGRPRTDERGKPYVHIRKSVQALSASDIAAIVDPAVRRAVVAQLERMGGDPRKAFDKPENHPVLRTKDGRAIAIHKVRIRRGLSTFPVGRKHRERFVVPAGNHHIEIIEQLDGKRAGRWEDIVVDRYEAEQRLKRREPIVQRDHGPDKRFVMSLSPGDLLELDTKEGGRALYVVRGVAKRDITYCSIYDARLKKDIMAAGDWGRVQSMATFAALHPQKVIITPLGEVRRAGG